MGSGRYAPACIKLLAQYKSLMKLVGEDIGGVESFMKRFKVSPGHMSLVYSTRVNGLIEEDGPSSSSA